MAEGEEDDNDDAEDHKNQNLTSHKESQYQWQNETQKDFIVTNVQEVTLKVEISRDIRWKCVEKKEYTTKYVPHAKQNL